MSDKEEQRRLSEMLSRSKLDPMRHATALLSELEIMVQQLDDLGFVIPANYLSMATENLREAINTRYPDRKAN